MEIMEMPEEGDSRHPNPLPTKIYCVDKGLQPLVPFLSPLSPLISSSPFLHKIYWELFNQSLVQLPEGTV